MNKYKKPWKVKYSTGYTGEVELYHGRKTVEKIVDCSNRCVIETDDGVYGPDEETAEYIVKCVNEREDN